MAPIKFEENIKDKLEKRTLSPSSESWSKLSERLDADEKNSKNPIYWWLSIAALFLIMMAVSVQFFNSNESEEVMPQIVEENAIEVQLESEILGQKNNESIEITNEEVIVETRKEPLPIINETQIIDYKKATKSPVNKTIKLAEQNELKENKNLPNKNEQIIKQKENYIDNALIDEALAVAMQDLKNERSVESDREIDSLLKIASKEVFKEKLQKESSKTVDANTLLMSVEDEMGQSFRSKVFEALKTSYETVKTTVAERNN